MSRLFTFLFAGCVNPTCNYPRYKNDLQRVGAQLAGKPGSSIGTVTVMHADGTAAFSFNNHPAVVLAATRANLENALGTIVANVTEQDRFIFIASNHGGAPDSGEPTLWCWNEESVTASEFAAWCSPISSKRQVYILGQCYAGGFIPVMKGATRIVMSACSADQVSWASKDQDFDEFLLRVIEALEGGATNFEQVFSYAQKNDTQSEEPQVADGSGLSLDSSILGGP
jgi:hypothetical protein